MRRLLTFLLAAIAFVACTQNDVEELTANRQGLPETLTVSFEGGDTRVELNDALKTVWTEGDEVSVFYQSYENTRWAFQGTTGDRSGELKLVSGEITEQTMDNIIVAYPYDANYRIDIEDKALHASLPAVQSYKEGSYGAEGNIMVAAGDYRQIILKSVVGWLRVELTGEGEVVESVKVRGNDGEQVAGLVYINAADASIALAGSEVEESLVATEVVLNCGDGVELGAEATAFYIALLPQTFEHGMTLKVNYANGNYQTLVCDNSITISRNHISPIGIEANEEADVPTNQLWYTATELVEPYKASAFNAAIVSNEWNEATGEGVITFDGELTTIGDEAFAYCYRLTSVTIPDSVTTIGEAAFADCYSLTSVTIPDSVTTIGNSAFSSCSSLTSVTIPDSVTTIGGAAFSYCYSLTSVTIPDSVTTIGDGVFADCSNLAEFKGKFAADGGRCLIKDNTIIAYAEASGTTYTIPDSVTTIGETAFRGCNSLTSVTIPDSVTTIGINAFAFCESLTSVTIPDSVMTIGKRAFSYCHSLTSVTIGDSVTTIGYMAFYDCESLTSVTIPDSVTTIGDRAFYGCGSLTSVTIGDSVMTIGDYAFAHCDNLTSVIIPDSVTTIGEDAFYECNSLTCVYITDFAAWCNISFGDGNSNPLYYAKALYLNNELVTDLTIPNSVTTIGDYAFYSCESLTSVTIGNSVTTIGNRAFSGCSSLTSVTIPDSVTTIGKEAFYQCGSLTSVYCKATTPPTLGDSYVFDDNASGRKIYVPEGSLRAYKMATNWSEYADCFVEYDYSSTMTISYTTSDGMPVDAHAPIVSNSYQGGVGELKYFGKDIIPAGLFRNCDNLTSVTIPDSVTTIGDWAFYDCDSLTSVTIPDSVTSIGGSAFYYCNRLTSVTIGNSVTTIGDEAFAYCYRLTSVTIGDSVTTIGSRAFYYCYRLTSVTIPDSVTTIGNYAFYLCGSLTSVYCKATTPPTLDGGYVFYDNASGRKIYVTAESVEAYKAATNWSKYATDIVGYDFETGAVVE